MNKSAGLGASAVQIVIIGAYAAIVSLAGLFALPPLDRDEARFAQATTQMLETGDYVRINYQDRERNKKPAGIHWLQAASVSAFSDVEKREIWAYRIPSVIGVIVACVFTYLIGVYLYDRRTGLLAGLLLASAPVVAAEATIAKTDGVLLALVVIAQFAFVRIFGAKLQNQKTGWGSPLTFWIAHGAAVLIKGPIGPMISALTGVGVLLMRRRLGWVFAMRPVTGVVILALITAPWVWAIGVATEGRFFAEALGGDMAGKLGEAQESHSGPPGYHLLLLWGLFWPAAALIGPGIAHAWRDRRDWRAMFLLAWVLPAWLVFEIAATKLPHYVMPLYPALAILAAHAAVSDGAGQTLVRKLGALTYGFVAVIAAGLLAAGPYFFSADSFVWLCFAASGLILIGGILIASLFWIGRAYEGGVMAAVLSGLFAWALFNAVLPELDQVAVSPRLSTALETSERHPRINGVAPVAMAGYAEPSAVFLLGTKTLLTTGDGAGRALANGEVSAAIVEQRENDAFLRSVENLQLTVRSLAVIEGVNYSNAKAVALSIYVPANQFEVLE